MTQARDNPEASHAAILATEIRGFFGRLRRRLRDQTDSGSLSAPQISVLGRLGNAGIATVTSLAHEEGMRPQSMGAIVAALADAGLVRGTPDPEDGRQTILSLTESGLAWIQAGRAARQDWLTRAIEAKLTADQQKQLSSAMELLKRLVEP
jgi:DNA-binding MarR family transcriptional regulator